MTFVLQAEPALCRNYLHDLSWSVGTFLHRKWSEACETLTKHVRVFHNSGAQTCLTCCRWPKAISCLSFIPSCSITSLINSVATILSFEDKFYIQLSWLYDLQYNITAHWTEVELQVPDTTDRPLSSVKMMEGLLIFTASKIPSMMEIVK